MVREERCLRLEVTRVQFADRLGNGAVCARATFCGLSRVRDLLHERVLEAVDRIALRAFLEDQASGGECGEHGAELVTGQVGDPPEHGLAEAFADRCRRLQYGLLGLLQAVHAGRE